MQGQHVATALALQFEVEVQLQASAHCCALVLPSSLCRHHVGVIDLGRAGDR